MGYSVEMYFDPETEAQIQAVWDALAEAKLGDDMGALGFHPHVSLGLCEDLDEKTFRPLLETFAEAHLPFEMTLSMVGLFPGDVLFLGPVMDAALLKTHTAFSKMFRRHAKEPSPLYFVGRWVPHCTLTMNLRPDERGGAVNIALDVALPLKGKFERISLSTYKPVASRYRFLLS
ncbi:MAG: 2'-5' RNA ligase family protein [Myxococcota bacterium]